MVRIVCTRFLFCIYFTHFFPNKSLTWRKPLFCFFQKQDAKTNNSLDDIIISHRLRHLSLSLYVRKTHFFQTNRLHGASRTLFCFFKNKMQKQTILWMILLFRIDFDISLSLCTFANLNYWIVAEFCQVVSFSYKPTGRHSNIVHNLTLILTFNTFKFSYQSVVRSKKST